MASDLKNYYAEEHVLAAWARDRQAALLNKLTVAELRVLLIHYKYATNKQDAADWNKSDMVEAIAEEMSDADL